MGELEHEDDELVRLAMLRSRSIADRLGAVRLLAHSDADDAIHALVVLATRDEDPLLAHAVGDTLGQVCFRRTRDIDELVMADMTEGAYQGYDQAIARLLKANPTARMQRGHIGSHR